MPEAVAVHVIVAHLHHEIGLEGLPRGGPLGAPTARGAWGISREPWCRDKLLQARSQCGLVLGGYGGREADVMQETRIVVEAEQ
jgi:hypothetical protein